MSNRVFVALFVFAAACVGWFWRVAQDHGTPFLVRAAYGIACVLALVWWLQRRLHQPITSKEVLVTTETETPTKVSFNATSRAVTAMEIAADHARLTRTDTLNRAIQVYAGVTGAGFWTALRIVVQERATVRRFAAEKGTP